MKKYVHAFEVGILLELLELFKGMFPQREKPDFLK